MLFNCCLTVFWRLFGFSNKQHLQSASSVTKVLLIHHALVSRGRLTTAVRADVQNRAGVSLAHKFSFRDSISQASPLKLKSMGLLGDSHDALNLYAYRVGKILENSHRQETIILTILSSPSSTSVPFAILFLNPWRRRKGRTLNCSCTRSRYLVWDGGRFEISVLGHPQTQGNRRHVTLVRLFLCALVCFWKPIHFKTDSVFSPPLLLQYCLPII